MSFETIQMLVGGKWLPQGEHTSATPLIDPATGGQIAYVPHASPKVLDDALAAAADAFRQWKNVPAIQRAAILEKAAVLIEQRLEDIARVMTIENGKVLAESRAETQFAVDVTRWYAEEGKRTYGRIVPARMPSVRQLVIKEPIGPVAAFAAWNFPASNFIRKVAGALAAGCSIIMKASEETPGTAVALGRCFQDAGLPDGVLNLVFGVPNEISSHLLASPIIRKISFTGSTSVGKQLQKLAAENLARCTLELGGHAPVIVHHDADIEHALDTLAAFKFRNAGQVCTSPTRFFINETVYDRFAIGFAERASSLRLGNGLETPTQMGPLIAERRRTSMDAFVEDARTQGAEIIAGGGSVAGPGFFYSPTVLRDVPDTARVMMEEPFGPIAPLTSYKTLDEAVERANSLSYGLASFVFSRDAATCAFVSNALEAGLVGINHMVVSTPETPFGGVNESGYGSESGLEGLQEYQRTKFATELYRLA